MFYITKDNDMMEKKLLILLKLSSIWMKILNK